jgi:nucleotide-binding universal stress UspA family protein
LIKRILVPLDATPYSASAMDFSCWLAQRHSAEVTGLVALDIEDIKESFGSAPAGGFYYAERLGAAREKQALDYIQHLINGFKVKCEKAGVRHREAFEQGIPVKEIIRRSFYFDAMVMGLRNDFQFDGKDRPIKSISSVLHNGVTPVYAVPADIPSSMLQSKILHTVIAIDGSPLAGRALQHFAHLAVPDLAQVRLVASGADKDRSGFFLREAEALLRAHGFTSIENLAIEKEINQAMREDYYDWADLIVVGAHAKNEWLEAITGSLTRLLIDEARVILLIGI